MRPTLLLVDYENVHKFDISILNGNVQAIIFVGANQNPPKASKKSATAHRFTRVDFLKVRGNGKNALDFHIAFHLGRIYETAPDTECIVLSRDKGFDPLLVHLNAIGLACRRVNALEELLPPQRATAATEPSELIVCRQCKKASTIEHHGGRWCTNCGNFATPPDSNLLPSRQPRFAAHLRNEALGARHSDPRNITHPKCKSCHRNVDMTGGIFDDGEWMCGNCVLDHLI